MTTTQLPARRGIRPDAVITPNGDIYKLKYRKVKARIDRGKYSIVCKFDHPYYSHKQGW